MLTEHVENGQPSVLRLGQIGTVVTVYPGGVREAEFAHRDGRAFAILPLGATH